jgi:hypothetical protein
LDFKTLLSPCPVGVFLDEYFGRGVLHGKGDGARFSGLVPEGYADDVGSLGNLERAGEFHEPLAILAESIERELEAPVHVRLAGLTEPAELHRLDRDAMVVQVSGQVHCAINEESEGAAREATTWRGPLNAGHFLYIPRGCWVAMLPFAPPVDRATVQVRLEIENPTGADLLEWITGHVKQHPAFQTDIPRFGDPAARWEYMRELRRALARMIRDPRLLEWYRRETNLQVRATSKLSLMQWTDGAPGSHHITLLALRKPRIKRANLETLLLVTMGKRLAFPVDAAPLLHYLCDRAPVTVDEFFLSFGNEFEREELSDFLGVLSKEGVVGLRVPPQ